MRKICSFIHCLLAVALAAAQCDRPAELPRADGVVVGALFGAGGQGDQSFNDMTYNGLIRARKDFGYELLSEAPGPSPAERERALQRLLKARAQVIVVSGWEFEQLIRNAARQRPDVRFVFHDLPIEGYDNVSSTVFNHQQGAYLAGALAGWQTESGVVGFIGGMDSPTLHEFQQGFSDGARFARPTVRVLAAYAAAEGDFHGFEDPDRGAALALQQYANGADIIFAAAGLTNNGVIEAARRQRRFAIGVDADQDHLARGYVLTSMMKRLDVATYEELRQIAGGQFKPGVHRYGLASGGVSLSEMKYTRDRIPESTLQKLEALRKQLIESEQSDAGGS
ncbi:MAG: BMP family ABC transporter substrate-binding protein [Leptospirales bacterium]|nr:BMP family ABC transporter substrate-binding protein [Leptospirales bacterium]